MCARCVCTYVSSALLQKRPMMIHLYHHFYIWWYICVLPVSVHMYCQAPCVCTCVLSALCVAPVLYMCIISSFAKETYDDTYVCSLCLYICIASSLCLLLCYTCVSSGINICIIIGLFWKRADDTYVQTQGAWWYVLRMRYLAAIALDDTYVQTQGAWWCILRTRYLAAIILDDSIDSFLCLPLCHTCVSSAKLHMCSAGADTESW